MKKVPAVALFEGSQIRRHWDADKELWYFSVVDIISALTDSTIPRRYWSDLKKKLLTEGSQLYEKIVQLKFIRTYANQGKPPRFLNSVTSEVKEDLRKSWQLNS